MIKKIASSTSDRLRRFGKVFVADFGELSKIIVSFFFLFQEKGLDSMQTTRKQVID